MASISDAILEIKSDAQVSISGEDVTTIIWHDGNPTNITNQQILDKKTELDAAEAAAHRVAGERPDRAVQVRQHHRQGPSDAAAVQALGAGCGLGHHGADPRRERHGKGARRPGAALQLRT